MNNFFVTLPSNASMQFYPDNTLSNYVTNLNKIIKLEGKYEVALTEIMYPFNFKFRKDASIVAKNSKTGKTETFVLQLFAYETVTDLFSNINDFMKRKEIPIEFYYNKKANKATIRVNPPWTLQLKDGINKDLGFKINVFQAIYENQGYFSDQLIPDQLNSINTFFIYSDIVDYQYVGDSYTPLLRVVPVRNQSKYGEYVHEIFTSPHYVPVCRSVIDKIEIGIKSDIGEHIRFNSGKVIVKLHFQQVKNYGF